LIAAQIIIVATKTPAPAYRREGGYNLIEIRLREVRQLFQSLDPAPFREKDLDEAAEKYLIEACREAGARRPSRLIVHLPAAEAASDAAHSLQEAVHHYFEYRQYRARTEILRLLRYGAVSLVIGTLFLTACLTLRSMLVARGSLMEGAPIGDALLILGWVAIWRPAEVLLYDWLPLARHRSLLRRLAAIPIEVRAAGEKV
jgi:hypothetical protein